MKRAAFDITMDDLVKIPPLYNAAYLNQRWVQEALSVPLNWTASADIIPLTFLFGTGDPMIYDSSALESILARGVNVAIANGDRDYRCNCELPC